MLKLEITVFLHENFQLPDQKFALQGLCSTNPEKRSVLFILPDVNLTRILFTCTQIGTLISFAESISGLFILSVFFRMR